MYCIEKESGRLAQGQLGKPVCRPVVQVGSGYMLDIHLRIKINTMTICQKKTECTYEKLVMINVKISIQKRYMLGYLTQESCICTQISLSYQFSHVNIIIFMCSYHKYYYVYVAVLIIYLFRGFTCPPYRVNK